MAPRSIDSKKSTTVNSPTSPSPSPTKSRSHASSSVRTPEDEFASESPKHNISQQSASRAPSPPPPSAVDPMALEARLEEQAKLLPPPDSDFPRITEPTEQASQPARAPEQAPVYALGFNHLSAALQLGGHQVKTKFSHAKKHITQGNHKVSIGYGMEMSIPPAIPFQQDWASHVGNGMCGLLSGGQLSIAQVRPEMIDQIPDKHLCNVVQALCRKHVDIGVAPQSVTINHLMEMPGAAPIFYLLAFSDRPATFQRFVKACPPGFIADISPYIMQHNTFTWDEMAQHIESFAKEATNLRLNSPFNGQGAAILGNSGSMLAAHMYCDLNVAKKKEFERAMRRLCKNVMVTDDNALTKKNAARSGALLGIFVGAALKHVESIKESDAKLLERAEFGAKLFWGALAAVKPLDPVREVLETLTEWAVKKMFVTRRFEFSVNEFSSELEIQMEKCAAHLEARGIEHDINQFARWMNIAVHANGYR